LCDLGVSLSGVYVNRFYDSIGNIDIIIVVLANGLVSVLCSNGFSRELFFTTILFDQTFFDFDRNDL